MDRLEIDKFLVARPTARRGRDVVARLATLLFWVVLLPTPALALNFSLDIEFDEGAKGNFGDVDVIESDGELDFTITLIDELGTDADLHKFYFNLVGDFSGLGIKDTDAPSNGTEYALLFDPPVAGGAGSSFDYGISLGNGAGEKGNGRLESASFTLFSTQALSPDDLMASSFASGASIEIFMAAHVQGTSLVRSGDSETVGSVVPEPSTGLLLVVGLGLLARSGRAKPPGRCLPGSCN
jgi:hypothetical protein